MRKTSYALLSLVLLNGCAWTETSKLSNPENPKGVPWVEAKDYEVYVVVKQKDGKTSIEPLGRFALTDRVNGWSDEARKKWQTNYQATIFSNSTFNLNLYENGSLQTVTINSADGSKAAAETGKQILEIRQGILDKDKPADAKSGASAPGGN